MADNAIFSNANLFNKLPPSYYLKRSNHVGTQPISSIEGLTDIINASTGIYASIVYVNSQDAAYYVAAQNYAVAQDNILWNYAVIQDASLLAYDARFIKSASLGIGLFWNGAYFDVSITSGTSKTYVDGSLAYYIKSASIGNGLYWNNGILDVSVIGGGGISQAYVDGSLATLNASVNIAFLTNVSLATLTSRQIYIDACLGRTSTLTYATNASINAYITNVSVNLALSKYIKSASTGSGLHWNAGLLDVSIGVSGVSQSYVDGSLNNIRTTYIKKIGDTIDGSLFIGENLTSLNPFVPAGTGGTAYSFDTSQNLVAGDYLFELNNKSITAFYVNYQGATYGKSFNAYSSSTNYSALNLNDIRIIPSGGNLRTFLNPITADGSNAAYLFDTNTSIFTSKLLSVRNFGSEKFYIDASGVLYPTALRVTSSGSLSTSPSLIEIYNASTAVGLRINNRITGAGIYIDNFGSGIGTSIINQNAGIALRLDNYTGTALFINNVDVGDQIKIKSYINSNVLKAIDLNDIERIHFNINVPNISNSIAYMFDTATDLSGGAKLISLKKYGTEKFYVDVSGNAYANGVLLGASTPSAIRIDGTTAEYQLAYWKGSDGSLAATPKLTISGGIMNSAMNVVPVLNGNYDLGSTSYAWNVLYAYQLSLYGNNNWPIASRATNSSTAVGFSFKTNNTFTDTAKLLSVRNNTLEKFYIDSSGVVVADNVRQITKQTLTDQATILWDMNISATAQVTLTASRILDVSNARSGDNGTLIVIQGGTGSYTLTLPTGSLTQGGTYSLSTAVASKDVLAFFFDGNNYFWNIGKAYA